MNTRLNVLFRNMVTGGIGLSSEEIDPCQKEKKPRVQRLAHYPVGLIVIVKGIEKAEHFSEHPVLCLALLFIGGFILFANFRHHYFEKYFKEFDVVLFFCESIVLVIVSIYYSSEGKKGLPYAYLVGAIVYFIVAVRLYRKKPGTEISGTNDIKAVTVDNEIKVPE